MFLYVAVIHAKKLSLRNGYYNTCGFDSTIQSLYCIYNDNESFRRTVDKSNNSSFKKMIQLLASRGAVPSFYRSRQEVIREIFGTEEDCYCTLDFIITKIKSFLYSYRLERDCNCFPTNCIYFTYLPINVRLLELLGIKNLQKCLILPEIKCTHETVHFNELILIEISYLEVENYFLEDIPIELQIGETYYGLNAIINFCAAPQEIPDGKNHFNSYCRRPDGTFKIYDNQTKQPKIPTNDSFTPSLLLYHKN